MKSEFKLLERVQLVNLPTNSELLGKHGFIAGKSTSHAEFDIYIVWLDVPTDTHMAVSVTENCIDSEPAITGSSVATVEF